jgi:hypothetical protein
MIEVQPVGHTDAQRLRAGCRAGAHTTVPLHNTHAFARSGAERNIFSVANRCTAHATRSFTSHRSTHSGLFMLNPFRVRYFFHPVKDQQMIN